MRSYQQFFAEMKRRRVFRIMAAYGIIGFGIIQAAEAIFPRVALPDWAVTLVVWLTLLGFPIAVLLAWAFDSTPDGMQRTGDAAPGEIDAILALPAARRWGPGLLALAGVALLFGGWWMGRRGSRPELNLGVPEAVAADFVKVAVLPFDNVGRQSDDDVLASGLQYDLQRNLGKLGALRIVSARAVQEYATSAKAEYQIADELGTDYIIRGSVLRSGARVRVNVQLIDAETTENLWGDQFDQEITPHNLFDITSNIAVKVARLVASELSPVDLAALGEAPPSENIAALAAYNRAREPGLQPPEQLRHAERAVQLDSTFLRAWALVARLRSVDAWIGKGDANQALDALGRVEALGPDSPEAVAARAYYTYYVEQDFEEASVQLREALARAPSDGQLAETIADNHRRLGEWDQAVSAFRRAVEIDPRDPDLLTFYSSTLAAVGRMAAADEVAERALQIAPSNPEVRGWKVTASLMRHGDVGRARSLASELGLDPSSTFELRPLVQLALYDGDLEGASRLAAQAPRREFPFFEMGRLLTRGIVEGLRGMDTKAIGDSILELEWESTAAGIEELTDFAAYVFKNEQERAWPLLAEAERKALAGGENVVLELVRGNAAAFNARLGRTEEALEALDRIVDRPGLSPSLVDLQHGRDWDALRDDARFDTIVERRRAFEAQAALDAEADRPWLP